MCVTLMVSNLCVFVTLGVTESGLVSSQMRTKLGTTTRDLKINLTMSLRMTVLGG